MSEKLPVWMDVDTGTDDAVALLALHYFAKEGKLEILGLSSVCGNSPHECTYRNTRCINALLKTEYPVFPGADRPLMREAVHASYVHGENGLGDVELPLPENEVLQEKAAWNALYEAASERKGELCLIATGPLTNLAVAFLKYPDLPGLLDRIILMGGATREGNVTPAAEFNIYADPEAAEIVFRAGAPIVMCPLDVTEKVYFTGADLEELRDWGNPAGIFVHDILQKAMDFIRKAGFPGVQMHDSCTVFYLMYPELFETEEAGVVVETKGEITLGKTVTDLYSDKQFEFKNALVALDVDAKAFMDKLKSIIRSL